MQQYHYLIQYLTHNIKSDLFLLSQKYPMKLYAQRFVHCCWFELWKDKNYFCRQVKIEIKPTKCLINFFVDILLNDKQLMLFIIANAMKLMRKFAKCSNINDRFIVVGRTFNSFCCLYILYCLFSNFYSTHDTLFSILRNAANDKCWTLFCLCTVYNVYQAPKSYCWTKFANRNHEPSNARGKRVKTLYSILYRLCYVVYCIQHANRKSSSFPKFHTFLSHFHLTQYCHLCFLYTSGFSMLNYSSFNVDCWLCLL